MKRGQSYIGLTDENVNHPIIKALHKKGVRGIEILYGSHWSTNAGWEMISSNIGHEWFGFTKAEALRKIEEMSDKIEKCVQNGLLLRYN